MIIVDSRERKFDHIRDVFDKKGVPYEVRKLDVGDYFNTENPKVVIDRKANLQEICGNLSYGKNNRTRFAAECKRAFNQKIKFIVLIEGTNCRNTADVKSWHSRYSNHSGFWLCNEMFRLSMAYNVEWMFCKKNETAKKILELLEYDK